MKIDPRRLLELLAVARHGSLNSAAIAANVSQPALSKSMSLLERDLGVRLLDRDRAGARLNPFGASLAFHAEALETLLARAQTEIELRKQGMAGELAIGVTPVASADLVPRALDLLIRQAPQILVTVVEGLDDELQQHLRQGQLDVVVGPLGVGPELADLVEEPLLTDTVDLIVRAGHPLAAIAQPVHLADLTEVPWVLPSPGSVFRRHLEALFVAAGTRWPGGGITTNSILAIKSVVRSTDSVALMSRYLTRIERKAGELVGLELAHHAARRPVGIISRRNHVPPPLAIRFAATLRQAANTEARGAGTR
jgi:DNA-binding transcriptional LysR family regulator